MLDNSHLSLFLNLLGLGLEVIGFAWILTKEIKCKHQQPNLLRPTQHLDDIESPIIKLVDLERQAINDLDNTMPAPITYTSYISDKMPGTKRTGIQLIALGFFIQIGALFF
jgi:hypothetical protein